jgi:hypothetical protein
MGSVPNSMEYVGCAIGLAGVSIIVLGKKEEPAK